MKKWILITTLTATVGCAAAAHPVAPRQVAPHPGASRPGAQDGDGIEAYRFKAGNGETVDAEWGRFSVPENRSRQDSRTLQLSFVRFRSTHPNPGPPIVYLAGGPGGSGIQTARGPRFALFMAMRAHADVIAFDQRGTGMSGREALDCQTPYALPFDQPLSRSGLASSIRQATRTCLEKHRAEGIDLDGYTTQQSAADLDALRKFLGASKLSLWAISYGTHLALATAKYHPQIVHRMILAGVEGPDHTYKMPNDQQIMLEEIAKRAATDAAVVERMPDLMASIRRLLAELASAPKTVMLADPMSAKAGPVVVGATDLQLVLAHMLGGPAAFAAMPDLVWRLEQGDWTALAVLAASSRRGQGLHGMSLAMDCASGASSSRRARIAQQAANTLLEDIINAPMPDVCEGLGLPRLSDAFRAPVRSDIPTLLISGTLDGRTPVGNGQQVAAHLENAQHLIIEGAGHSDPLFLSSPKILETMQAFLRQEPLTTLRIELPPVRFIPPRRPLRITKEALSRFVGAYRIRGDDVRRVVLVGDLLWTIRGKSMPFPIRPASPTEFYYEGVALGLKFLVDDSGAVTGMQMLSAGAEIGEPAERIQ